MSCAPYNIDVDSPSLERSLRTARWNVAWSFGFSGCTSSSCCVQGHSDRFVLDDRQGLATPRTSAIALRYPRPIVWSGSR